MGALRTCLCGTAKVFFGSPPLSLSISILNRDADAGPPCSDLLLLPRLWPGAVVGVKTTAPGCCVLPRPGIDGPGHVLRPGMGGGRLCLFEASTEQLRVSCLRGMGATREWV